MRVEVEDVRAWIDGELDDHRASEVASAVSSDATLKQAAAAMRASQLPYHEAYEEATVPDLPEGLRSKIEALQSPASVDTKKQTPFKMIGIAASVLMAALIGYLAGSYKDASAPATTASNDTLQLPENFARNVAGYQAFYVRETLEGTDNSPAAVAALAERLAQQTGIEIIIPELEGYEFVRGQRLSFNEQPLLQLVYLGEEGRPLALCYMPTQLPDSGDATVKKHHGLNTAEWISNSHRFVIVGDTSKEKLDELSQSALRQWEI